MNKFSYLSICWIHPKTILKTLYTNTMIFLLNARWESSFLLLLCFSLANWFYQNSLSQCETEGISFESQKDEQETRTVSSTQGCTLEGVLLFIGCAFMYVFLVHYLDSIRLEAITESLQKSRQIEDLLKEKKPFVDEPTPNRYFGWRRDAPETLFCYNQNVDQLEQARQLRICWEPNEIPEYKWEDKMTMLDWDLEKFSKMAKDPSTALPYTQFGFIQAKFPKYPLDCKQVEIDFMLWKGHKSLLQCHTNKFNPSPEEFSSLNSWQFLKHFIQYLNVEYNNHFPLTSWLPHKDYCTCLSGPLACRGFTLGLQSRPCLATYELCDICVRNTPNFFNYTGNSFLQGKPLFVVFNPKWACHSCLINLKKDA